MFSQLRHLAEIGVERGFFHHVSSISERFPLIFHHGPLTSNLLFYFRHEWIKSFVRHSCGYYNYRWYDSIEPSPSTDHLTIGWQSEVIHQSSSLPMILQGADPTVDQCLRIRYFNPRKEITMVRLADQRTRFWKKYLSERQQLECLSSKQRQFHIAYRLSPDLPTYQLETIEQQSDSTFDLILNLNQTLMILLIDSKMTSLHPLLTVYQIGLESDEKAVDIALHLAKILTLKHQLRVLHQNGEMTKDTTIPFRLIVDEKSVKNGLCSVWNRDTQLEQNLHVKFVCKHLSEYFHALDEVL